MDWLKEALAAVVTSIDVLSGMPVIRGTRVPVASVAAQRGLKAM